MRDLHFLKIGPLFPIWCPETDPLFMLELILLTYQGLSFFIFMACVWFMVYPLDTALGCILFRQS